MIIKREAPLKVVDKGRNVGENQYIGLVDANGRSQIDAARIEVIAHSQLWNNFTVSQFPPSLDANLVPMILRRAADRVELELLQSETNLLNAEAGEIVLLGNLRHIVVGVVPGHQHPTVVADWTGDDAYSVPIHSNSVGPNKASMWSDMVRRNRPEIKYGVTELYGKGKGKGVIIAGSGPSLQSEYLSKLDHPDWDVIACNDAYRLMNSNADYFMMLEAEANPKWWSKINKKTKAIFSIYAHADAPKEKWNAKFWFAAWPPKLDMPSNQEFAHLGRLHEQLNVTISAFHLAYLMGYDPIVFAGCDFAYTNSEAHQDEAAKWRDLIYTYAETVNGGLVLTDAMWALMSKCHEAAAHFVTEKGVKVYNCTENGIMTGVECKKLVDVIGEAK